MVAFGSRTLANSILLLGNSMSNPDPESLLARLRRVKVSESKWTRPAVVLRMLPQKILEEPRWN
jgi:hypothetical protein